MSSSGGGSGEARQRRRKRTTTSTGPQPTTPSDPNADPEATLSAALARISVANKRTADLHEMWRSSLQKLSYLVIVLSLHQLNSLVGVCVGDVKGVNANLLDSSNGTNEMVPITGPQTLLLIIKDASPLLIGLLISILLVQFTSLKDSTTNAPADFGNRWYYVSAALVPMCISLHFQLFNAAKTGGDDMGMNLEEGISTCLSCLPAAAQYLSYFDPGSPADISTRPKKQLPVVVVYHTIVTVSYWFMKQGRDQCRKNVILVQDMQRKYEEVKGQNIELKKEKEAKNKKKSGGGGGSNATKKK